MDDVKGYDIGRTLGEMREAYWDGVSELEQDRGEVLECLVFTLGGRLHAFETGFASEILRVPRLARLPAVREMVAGVFNLRGEITAAMDVRLLLGLPSPPLDARGRIVVVKGDSFSTGILVEGAHGVQEFSFDSFDPAEEGGNTPFVRGVFGAPRGVTLLDLPALLAAPEMIIGEGP